ncbi:hypothetical protein HZ993_10575 [Rhodoferax sp. AJA081-3]|uniref:hypothetical protein n=1 Tax=Rhodoferax sp. AJA081-3 TaxID=2752316 RepID=UPI001ADFA4CC|nr:hypothetical protein [Rhodoferax sp. AJA081-3]QTN30205.1 hypothetical protein HZ993_10575 [Rhodoferax sp. AJA081-3]
MTARLMQAMIRASSVIDFPEVERFIQRQHQGGLADPSDVAAAIVHNLARPSLTGGERHGVSV